MRIFHSKYLIRLFSTVMIVQSILDQIIIMQKWSLSIKMVFIASLLILPLVATQPQDPGTK